MERLFQTHQIRKTINLEGIWEFTKLEAQSELDISTIQYNYLLPVPGCWENHPELLTYRGRGLYRRRVNLPQSQPARLVCKGVSHTARIYWDGTLIAEHYNAYTAFSVIIPDAQAGEHELAVEVDNSFGNHSALHLPNDYYTYGGLIRPVILELLPADSCWIEQVHITPYKSSWEPEYDGQWEARIQVRLHSLSDNPVSGRLQLKWSSLQDPDLSASSVWIDTHSTAFGQHTDTDAVNNTSNSCLSDILTLLPGEVLEWETICRWSGIRAWNPHNPDLYELHTEWHESRWDDAESTAYTTASVGHSENTVLSITGQTIEPVDDLIERFGFRTILAEAGDLLLNNERIVLRGFNRHEDHPLAGSALPLSLMVQDMELMVQTGANAVRTSHYPNDERFLDLCDQYGMLVWEENHARGLSIEDMRHPLFVSQCEQVNREMVEQHYNHPSIIIWAILNECASNLPEGRVHYERQLNQIRALDQSRLLSFASHHREQELCFDLADIVSFNLYPGWYGEEDPGELCDQARGWADATGGAGKPMMMSEFGADGFYGYRSPSRVKGTEERQLDIIEDNLRAYTSRDYLSGMFIWQFCDCRVTEEGIWPMLRARTQNNKGVVDGYRRPKLAYDMVKSYFKHKV
ncbi:glycoside hydrolase family 2 protein [Paenibacillus bovis]|uniref:glycoside hydrolase family 2 protein n=1 Tax=Paenibacillus bovis TaxID=1616788 RepID=UPI000761D8FC|nr:glycoside hydrolase family 2 TIM barrel-domain containing protein [Paenibacillus bovis]